MWWFIRVLGDGRTRRIFARNSFFEKWRFGVMPLKQTHVASFFGGTTPTLPKKPMAKHDILPHSTDSSSCAFHQCKNQHQLIVTQGHGLRINKKSSLKVRPTQHLLHWKCGMKSFSTHSNFVGLLKVHENSNQSHMQIFVRNTFELFMDSDIRRTCALGIHFKDEGGWVHCAEKCMCLADLKHVLDRIGSWHTCKLDLTVSPMAGREPLPTHSVVKRHENCSTSQQQFDQERQSQWFIHVGENDERFGESQRCFRLCCNSTTIDIVFAFGLPHLLPTRTVRDEHSSDF